LSLTRNENRLVLKFQLVYKQQFMARNFEQALSFVIYPPNGAVRKLSPINIQFDNSIYREKDQVEIQFDLAPFQQEETCCFYFDLKPLYPHKGKQLCYAFIA